MASAVYRICLCIFKHDHWVANELKPESDSSFTSGTRGGACQLGGGGGAGGVLPVCQGELQGPARLAWGHHNGAEGHALGGTHMSMNLLLLRQRRKAPSLTLWLCFAISA